MHLNLASVVARQLVFEVRVGTSHPGSGGSNDKVSDQALFRGCRRVVAAIRSIPPKELQNLTTLHGHVVAAMYGNSQRG